MVANGASTALFQQALRLLLQGQNPSPLSPVPIGPMTPPGGPLLLPPGPPPELPPIAPAPALDQSLIEQLAGPRPVAPVTQPDSLLQKISRMLIGFGAGTQGQGPQYLAGLREERERPQREFRAATEQYEGNRRRAIGIAEEKQQRGQAQTQRRADEQSSREFQLHELDVRDRMQEARDLRQQAAALEREEVKARADLAEQQRKEKAQQERDARLIARDFGKAGARPAVAKNLGDYYAGLTDKLSSEAAKFESAQARLAEVRANRAASGGTGGKDSSKEAELVQRTLAEFNTLKNLALQKAEGKSDAVKAEEVRKETAAVVRRMAARSDLYEVGVGQGGYMYAKPRGERGAAPQQQQGGQIATMDDIRAYMEAMGVDEATAKADARAKGYKVQ